MPFDSPELTSAEVGFGLDGLSEERYRPGD